jgi:hypothetical protein
MAWALTYDGRHERQDPILLDPGSLSLLCACCGHECFNAPVVGSGSLGRGGGDMANRSISQIAIVAIALIAYVTGFWIWRSYGFPVDHDICKHAADGTNYDCAPQNVGLIALRKIGEAFSDLTFVTTLATIAIAAFTGTLWLSTRGMLRATNESIGLASREFVSSHRPRMRLKHMWLTDLTASRLDGPLEVNLDIVNVGNTEVGNTEGFITWVNYTSVVIPAAQRLPQRPPYDEMPFGPHMRITRFKTETPLAPGITLARPVCDGSLDQQQVHDIR